MIRTSSWVLVLALAVSACSNDAGGNDLGGAPVNAAAAEAAGNGSAAPLQSTPVPSSKAAAQPLGMPLGRPLGPLLEEDRHSPERMGCNCMFQGREGMYLSVIDRELMVRTPAGRQLCPITDAQLESIDKPGGEVSCGGVQMSIRETGERVSSIESDSSSAPAVLSATENGVTRTLDGDWGCAC
ncbi:MAG: hypothetical protein WBR13_16455 [Allosphingosinicella sp.]